MPKPDLRRAPKLDSEPSGAPVPRANVRVLLISARANTKDERFGLHVGSRELTTNLCTIRSVAVIKCKLSLPPIDGTSYKPPHMSLFTPGATLNVTCGARHWISTRQQISAVSTCKNDGKWSITPICQGMGERCMLDSLQMMAVKRFSNSNFPPHHSQHSRPPKLVSCLEPCDAHDVIVLMNEYLQTCALQR